jgi:hypothetical protein
LPEQMGTQNGRLIFKRRLQDVGSVMQRQVGGINLVTLGNKNKT